MRIYIWSTNCFNKYRFKIWCKSMRYLVYSICSFHLKTRAITPSGNIVKNKWLIFTWFWRKATVYNLQCPNNFFHIRYINKGVQCLLNCAVADDDLGVSKALICEAEFDSSFFFEARSLPSQFFKMFLSFFMICYCRQTTWWEFKSFVTNETPSFCCNLTVLT